MPLKIAPSILSAHFERLGEDVRAAEAGGADEIHVDVMDGHFVPNLSMGPIVVQALRRVTNLPLDVHLMITSPESYLEAFVKAGAHKITFHAEVAAKDASRLAAWLHARNLGSGIAVNPETPAECLVDLAPHFDRLLVMTVRPGFGGQAFLPETLEKIRLLRRSAPAARGGKCPEIQVDGGIDARTAVTCRDAGADVFVAGNSVFGGGDPAGAVQRLRQALETR